MQVNLTWGVRVRGEGATEKVCFFLISSQSHIGDFGDWGWDIDRQTFLFEKKKLHGFVSLTFDQQVVYTTVCSSSWKEKGMFCICQQDCLTVK